VKISLNFGRKAVTVPIAFGSALAWIFMFSFWIGQGKEPEKEKALAQTIAKQEVPAKEPESVKPEAKPEPAAANPQATAAAATVQPVAQASKPAAEVKPAAPAALQAGRKAMESQGAAFIAAGHGLDDLPTIEGGSDSIETYIQFSRLAGYKFAVYSPEGKKYLGEIKFGENPTIVPLKLAQGFSQRGRLVEHETLVRIARETAGNDGVLLYALCPNGWTAYLAGKILEAMKICGVSDRREVAAFKADFEVRGSKAVAVFKRLILSSGKEIVINDSEG